MAISSSEINEPPSEYCFGWCGLTYLFTRIAGLFMTRPIERISSCILVGKIMKYFSISCSIVQNSRIKT